MRKAELEHLLRSVGEITRDRNLILFGSQAVLGYLRNPPRALLVSMEADVYPKTFPQAQMLIIPALGRRSAFHDQYGYYADSVTPDLATFPEGWTDRLIPFSSKNTGGVTAWCVEIHDITVSKLAAYRPKDIRYITALLRHKLIRVAVLRQRIDLVPTPADQKRLHAGFDELLKQFRRARRAKPAKRPARKK